MGSSSVFPGDRVYDKSGGQENPITIREVFNVIEEQVKDYFGKDQVVFVPEYNVYHPDEQRNVLQQQEYNLEPTQEDNENLDNPLIVVTYKLKKRKHFEQSSRKPIKKEVVEGDNKDEQYIEEGEMFDNYVEFGFWGKSYHEVTKFREKFEEFIYKRLYNFKQEGIIKLLFEEQKEDSVVEINNNYFSNQRVIYYLRNARILKKPYSPITDININKVNDNFKTIKERNFNRKLQ